jgi:hypothetical protein
MMTCKESLLKKIFQKQVPARPFLAMTAAKWAYGSAAIAANGSGRKRQEHQYI